MGIGARVEHAAGAGTAIRSGHRRRSRHLPAGSGDMAQHQRRGVSGSAGQRRGGGGRRRCLVTLLVALVALLVGGRWIALATVERAWAATIPAGAVYLAV